MKLSNKKKIIIVVLLVAIYMAMSCLVTIKLRNGTFIYRGIELPIFDTKSYINLVSHKYHEKKLTSHLQSIQKEINNKTIIDAGAYIGDTSLFLAKNNPEQLIYAIEPSLSNVKFINKIKNINKLKNIGVLRYLLSDKSRNHTVKNADFPNAAYTETENPGSDTTKSETLDKLISDDIIKGPIGLLHYDVEGMELEVLQGSINTISKDKPIIIVETLGTFEKNKELHDYLVKLNYYKYETIKESCAFGDILNRIHCRNHIYKPL